MPKRARYAVPIARYAVAIERYADAMAILIDPPQWPAHGTLWSHLVSDTDYAELHEFAARLNVPRRGFDLDHYDVPASLHGRAVELGALPVSPKVIVHRLRDSGLRVRQADREAVTPIRRREYLRGEWAALGRELGIGSGLDADLAVRWQQLGEDLILRWNEPHRRYHDERHLEDVLLSLNQLGVRGEQVSPVTLLAAWFHDTVYAGAVGAEAGSDERASAELATASLAAFSLDAALVAQLGELIIATTPGHSNEDPPAALAHLLDADLAIFAAAPERYDRYAAAVRLEYAHVPDAAFCSGRAQILEAYVQQPAIYRTDAARGLWEARARANLSREIAELRAS